MGLMSLMLAGTVLAQDATGPATRQKVIQQRREEVREIRDQNREEMKAKREEFKQKLQTVRDERKKKIVEQADAKLTEINKRRTDAMVRHLDKMGEILAKVKVRGGDTTAAEAAVAAARSAVVAQAAKTYTITISTEDKLKINVGETMKALKTDLQAVHQKIVDARKTIADVIRSVKKASPAP